MPSTKIVKLDPLNPDPDCIKQAADIIREGGLVIIPTETVYGIAANMLNKKALQRLYEIKQRPKEKPFTLHIGDKEKIEHLAQAIPVSAYKLMDKFWPGPLTILLKSKNHERVGLRMPDDKIALEVIKQADVPVVCPSANLSGSRAPAEFDDALKDMNGRVEFAIDAGRTSLALESTIVDLTVEPIKIIRAGAIKEEDIFAAVKKKIILFVCTGNSCRSVMAKALLEKRLKERNRDDIEVLSAGIMMLSGLGASEETRQVLLAEGIDVSAHQSQRISDDMIKKSDIILAMEGLQEKRILELNPDAKNKLFLLKEFAKINDNNFDIEDPIGRSRDFYESTFLVIKQAIERVSELI